MKCFLNDKFMLDVRNLGDMCHVSWITMPDGILFADTPAKSIRLENGTDGYMTQINGRDLIIEQSWIDSYQRVDNLYPRLMFVPEGKEVVLSYYNGVSTYLVLVYRDGKSICFEDMFTKEKLAYLEGAVNKHEFMVAFAGLTKGVMGFDPFHFEKATPLMVSKEYRRGTIYGIIQHNKMHIVIHDIDVDIDMEEYGLKGTVYFSDSFKQYRKVMLRIDALGRYYMRFDSRAILLEDILYPDLTIYDFVKTPLKTTREDIVVVDIRERRGILTAIIRNTNITGKDAYRRCVVKSNRQGYSVTLQGTDVYIQLGDKTQA